MQNDLIVLYALKENFDAFLNSTKEAQKSLLSADISEFIIALQDICADEFLPILNRQEKEDEGNFEILKQNFLREYHDNLL